MSQQMDALIASVARTTQVTESVVTFIMGLKQQLDDLIAAGADPAKLQELSATLEAQCDRIAQAMVQNTEPGPKPTPEPVPDVVA